MGKYGEAAILVVVALIFTVAMGVLAGALGPLWPIATGIGLVGGYAYGWFATSWWTDRWL